MDLPYVHIRGRQAGPGKRLGDRERGRDPHDLRVERVRGRGHHPSERLCAELLRGRGAGQDDGARAVVERR